MLRLLAPLGILAASALLLWYVFFPSSVPPPPERTLSVSHDSDWYPERRWDDRPPGDLNISVFVYRDRNRNGIYDIDDLPMASVAVLLERPDSELRMERSNTNGYANFKVSAGNPAIDIGRPDTEYRFVVLPPPGWSVTSGNARQSARFELLTGAPAGMVTTTPPVVIGLAPAPTVSGSVAATNAATARIFALGPEDGRRTVDVATDGSFSFTAEAGPWRLISEHEGEARVLHEFDVWDAPVLLSRTDLTNQPMPEKPYAMTVDFEGFDRSILEKLATGYRGLDWDYLLAVDNQHYRGPGYANTLSGGSAVGYNSSGYPVTVRGLRPNERFDFVGAYFGVAWPQAEGEMLTLEAWRGDEQVHSDRIRLSHLGPLWFQADYRDIDRLRLTTDHYWQFTTDDMRFRLAQAPPR